MTAAQRPLSLEERILRLEAIEAVRVVVMRYAWAADRGNDAALMRPLFDDAAVWESPQFGRFEGVENILAAMTETAATRITRAIHFMVTPTVQVDEKGMTATCNWYLWELARVENVSGISGDSYMAGIYEARLRKCDADWKFTRIFLDIKVMGKMSGSGDISVG